MRLPPKTNRKRPSSDDAPAKPGRGNRGRVTLKLWPLPFTATALLVAATALLPGFAGCAVEEPAESGRPTLETAAAVSSLSGSTAEAEPMPADNLPSPAAQSTTPADVPTGGLLRQPEPAITPPTRAMVAADFPTPPDRDLRLLARQMRWDGAEPPNAGPMQTDGWQVGDARDFWTLDYPNHKMASSGFRLAAVSDSAYWWISEGADVDDDDLQGAVTEAEARVFPRVEDVFAAGSDSSVSDDRFHVISARIPGVGGYVSGNDQYPASVSPFSNEVEAIYINNRAANFGDPAFLNILAHELQHAIHQRADESEATWLNEGLSELAVTEAGYPVGSIRNYLRWPAASVVNWPDELGADIGLNYGAAALFIHYLREHYAPDGGLQDLLALQDDGIRAVDQFLSSRGAVTDDGTPADFHSVFADWMVANLLDLDSGVHGYRGLNATVSNIRRQEIGGGDELRMVAQYGVKYVETKDADEAGTVRFAGAGTTPLLAVDVPDGGCWWSNRGDTISSTLTRQLAVPATASDGSESKLTYRYWHDIEEDWDYLYVSASADGGATWDVLTASGATDTNPLGNSYGFGYTGASGGWKDGEASLADYAGGNVLVRFHYVTDDAINGPGFCVREMEAPGDSDSGAVGEWDADGFVLVNNRVRQDWIVWVIVEGSNPSAERVPLTWDESGQRWTGTMPAPDVGDGRLVIAVSAVAPATMESGEYRLWIEPR